MPEWHTVPQENAAPGDASAVAFSGLPTVESIFTSSRNLRGKAYRSSSSLRVVLAALASVAAIVILVFSCSHVYKRRAVQDFRNRRLASSDESDASIDVCGEGSGGEEQQQRERPRLLNLPAGGEKEVPLKKRLLGRVAEARTGGSAHEGQQQRQPQNLNEAAEVQSGSPGTQAGQSQELPGPSPPLAGSPPSSAQGRGTGELDAATGLLSLIPRHFSGAGLPSGARVATSLEVRQLRRRLRRMERLLQRERPRVQRQLQRLQKKLQRERQRRQQLEAQIQQAQGSVEMMSQPMQQHLLLQHLLWQQRQQQQYLHHQQWQHLLHQQQQQQQFLLQHQQQYLLQQQAHFHGMQQQQQQLSLPAGEQQQQQALLQRDQEKAERSVQQQEQQVTPPERPAEKRKQGRPQEAHLPGMQQQQQQLSLPAGEQQQQQALLQRDQEKAERSRQQQQQQVAPRERRAQKRKQRMPRRTEQAEKLQPERGPKRALRPATQTSGQSLEDEWIDLQSPTSETPQPSTSQQALPFPAPLAAARPSTSQDARMPAIPGASAAPVASPPAAAAEASRQEAPGGPAAGTGAASDLYTAAPSTSARTTAGGETSMKGPTVSSLDSRGSSEDAGAAAAGTAVTAAAPSATPASGSTAAGDTSRGAPKSASDSIRDHPFARLPQRIVRTTPAELLINLRRGVTAWPGRRDLMPLLVEARELLSKQFLYFDDMEKLAHVAEALIEHGTNHQRQDLSEHSPTRAVERLGMRFLLMDAVVSAFIVLGQKPDEKLWKSFTDAINHKPPLGHFYGTLGGRETWASQALQLSRAIETLKTGKRPKPEDLVHLKRMLICSPSSHPRFKKPDFNPWRQDNSEGADGE